MDLNYVWLMGLVILYRPNLSPRESKTHINLDDVWPRGVVTSYIPNSNLDYIIPIGS